MSIKDYNSARDQTIKEKFVDKEVFGCITSLMERIIKDEKKEVSMESDVLGSITTLMEDIIKSGRKDSSAEKDILKRTGTLMESIKGGKNCEFLDEIENLYKYSIDVPDIKNMSIHEKIAFTRDDVLETEREKIIKEIKGRIGVLKGEENVTELMLEDEEISEETNKENQAHIEERISELESCLTAIEETKGKPQNISEWMHVSNRLHDKLREKGEPVWNDGQIYVWGRTKAEQAILFDNVISEICSDMEILEGQKNEWKV